MNLTREILTNVIIQGLITGNLTDAKFYTYCVKYDLDPAELRAAARDLQGMGTWAAKNAGGRAAAKTATGTTLRLIRGGKQA